MGELNDCTYRIYNFMSTSRVSSLVSRSILASILIGHTVDENSKSATLKEYGKDMMTEAALLELVVRVSVIVVVFWLAGEFLVRVVITPSAKRAGVSYAQLRIFTDGLRFVLMVLAIVAVVRVTGLASEFTALTISGIAAISLSLALQTSLSNVISGVLLLLDNTLRINDLIEYSGIKGQVVKIGLRSSWVKTSEGNIVIISNSQIANGPLTNYTAGQRLMESLQD